MVNSNKNNNIEISNFPDNIKRTDESIAGFYTSVDSDTDEPSRKLVYLAAAMVQGPGKFSTIGDLYSRISKIGKPSASTFAVVKSLIETGYFSCEEENIQDIQESTQVGCEAIPFDMSYVHYKETISYLGGISSKEKRKYFDAVKDDTVEFSIQSKERSYSLGEVVDEFFKIDFKEPIGISTNPYKPSKKIRHYSDLVPPFWQIITFFTFLETLRKSGSIQPKDIRKYGYDNVHFSNAIEKGYISPDSPKSHDYSVSYRFTDDKEKMMRWAGYLLNQQKAVLSERHREKIEILADKMLELPAGAQILENPKKGDKWTMRHATLLLAFAEQCEDMTPPDKNGHRYRKEIKNSFQLKHLNTGKVNRRPLSEAVSDLKEMGYITDLTAFGDIHRVVSCPVRRMTDGSLQKMTREELIEGFALVLPEIFKGASEYTEECKIKNRKYDQKKLEVA